MTDINLGMFFAGWLAGTALVLLPSALLYAFGERDERPPARPRHDEGVRERGGRP